MRFERLLAPIEFAKTMALRNCLMALVLSLALLLPAANPARAVPAEAVIQDWYRLALELVRHTPTYSPPVASRTFAYLGVSILEATASGSKNLVSLAGQLPDLMPVPARDPAAAYDEAMVVHAALAAAVREFFANTGPTGQRALAKQAQKLEAAISQDLAADVRDRSKAYGEAIAAHVLAWSKNDGGAVIVNLGFPDQYALKSGKANWVPTTKVALQQTPLLPGWGVNRTFAMPNGASCPVPQPPAYSEVPGSPFHAEAMEVYETTRNLAPLQLAIARFWADDPMLTPTPPGHWIAIALDILKRDARSLEDSADVLARLGIGLADSFIGCWNAKFEFDLLRPVTYINRVIDPKWQPMLITPPFPEYPSGHSTQSGAAAVILESFFGKDFAFEDLTHAREGMKSRSYASFWQAAEEAGISRLYGGIHFRTAIERGLDQGRCVGAFATALKTRS